MVSSVLLVLDLMLPNQLIYNNVKIFTNHPPEGTLGVFYVLFTAVMLYNLVISAYVLIKKYKLSDNRKKQQIVYVVSGFLLFGLSAITSVIILPMFGIEEFYNLGQITSSIFIGFTSYAIIKHQLLDIRVVIQRGIIYSITFSIIVGIYLVLVFILGFIFQESTDSTVLLAAGLATVTGIYSVPYLERWFKRITNKIFFKDKYDYSEAVYRISEVLNKNLDLEILLSETTRVLKDIFKVGKTVIILPGENIAYTTDNHIFHPPVKPSANLVDIIERRGVPVLIHDEIPVLLKNGGNPEPDKFKRALEETEYIGNKYDFAVSVAILLNKKLIGLVSLGPKKSGDQFSVEDVSLLKTFSHQAAVSLERARLYKRVKKYSEELEKLVEMRTSKIKGLQEEQRVMMQEISHGLQTPLTILKGEIDLLSNEVKDNAKLKSLERSIDRVSKFIYDMLRLASLESEGKDFKKSRFDLSQTLSDLIESYKIITVEKGITVVSEIAPDICIDGDQSQIEELVTNLVSNSVKYMKEDGKKEINIELSKNKSKTLLKISDNGIGIAKNDLPYLFFRFHRIQDEAHARKKGTGLGLVISKEIVEKHGGQIKVESAVGQGAVFTVTLPNTKC